MSKKEKKNITRHSLFSSSLSLFHAASENSRGIGGGDRTAKAIFADQISQAVNSTANLLHLMRQSSSSQAQLAKLPKNLLAKASLTKATGQALAQLPQDSSEILPE
ncbi:hypothetical protein ISN45_Aa08g011290 [Arabidopsis thaliana x Arabidopsis arenosa]|uniref:Uncharacterized protein n=1 Tax=Arabidopsis thaliana x Arabidopsis arenosa TaxID=1240361 RepID=A0A8T1XHA0_9BRAS|nr:hypothetical protein ISN45_Aa08g011290 [Arabidopsis thaliana x Arabidopsis arenosa]